MIIFTQVTVKYMKKNLNKQNLLLVNKFCQSLGPLLHQGSTVLNTVQEHQCLWGESSDGTWPWIILMTQFITRLYVNLFDRHVVLGVHHNGRFGTLGLSRRDDLMFKPLKFKVSYKLKGTAKGWSVTFVKTW